MPASSSLMVFRAGIRKVLNLATRAFPDHQMRFVGDFADWTAASRASIGYGAEEIADHVLRAALKVKRGEAAYERDGVVFSRPEYSFPLVTGLLICAVAEKGRVRVLDFGGALGSSYFQNRDLLQRLQELRWGVVEQESFVARGQKHMADDSLRFYLSVEDCEAETRPNFVLLSGVLSYLQEPAVTLARLVDLRTPFIFLDRTLVAVQGKSRLTVQVVPSAIYKASYPCWILREEELLAPLAPRYRLLYEFYALGGEVRLDSLTGVFKGYLFARDDIACVSG